MGDVIIEKEGTFSVIYSDYCARGNEALNVFEQLHYDPPENPTGFPTFDSGDIAPTLFTNNDTADALAIANNDNFNQMLNPFGCTKGDERPQCLEQFAHRDPRFDTQERWNEKFFPSYSHQPFEEAVRAKLADEKANAVGAFNTTNTVPPVPQAITPILINTISFSVKKKN